MQNLIPLESIHIATPCHADWEKMSGDNRARYCQSCAKNVYNLSSMTRAEAERLITEKEGHLCVQLHRRADGTVITSDCPVGISPVRKSPWALQTLFAGAIAAILGLFGGKGTQAMPQNEPTTSPNVAMMGDVAPPLMGKPAPSSSPLITRGEVRRVPAPMPTPAPTAAPKAVKMPSKAGKSHGNRTSGKKLATTGRQHRRHR